MADETHYQGVLATGDDLTNKYPQDHDPSVYKYEIMGTVPFTAMMDKMPKKPATDVFINWEEEPQTRIRGDITDAYTDSFLSSAYVSGGLVGSELFLKGAEASLLRLRRGEGLIVHDRVTGRNCGCYIYSQPVFSGANSYIHVKLTEIDTNAVFASATLSYTSTGITQSEGAMLPVGLSNDLVHYDNRTEIFADSTELTGSQEKRKQWYGETEVYRQTRDMRFRFMGKQEMKYLFGVGATRLDPVTGKPARTLQGVVTELKRRATAGLMDSRIYNYGTDSDYTGNAWKVKGWDFLKKIMRQTCLFQTNVYTKDLFCGTGMWQRISDIVEDRTHYNWTAADTKYGFRVKVLQGLQKDVRIWQHPLLSEDPAFYDSGFLTEDGLCELRPYRPLKEISGGYADNNGNLFEDQKKWGLLYEGSMQYRVLENMAWITTADLAA